MTWADKRTGIGLALQCIGVIPAPVDTDPELTCDDVTGVCLTADWGPGLTVTRDQAHLTRPGLPCALLSVTLTVLPPRSLLTALITV